MWKLFGLYFLIFVVADAANDCSIILPSGIKEYAPVILKKISSNYQLFKPTGAVTTLKKGTQLLLSCTSSSSVTNSFISPPVRSTNLELTCENGKFVDSNKNLYELSNITCRYVPYSTLQMMTKRCFYNKGNIYQAGFTVNNKFYGPVFEMCHKQGDVSTFFTHNTINGAAIKNSITSTFRRKWNADSMGISTSVLDKIYQKEQQDERFDKMFGSGQKIIKSPNFLARGHLSPDADFIFGYEKATTYYYANVAPEFQLINGGNWLRVEELGRTIAEQYGDDIESYNGYKDVLKLKNKRTLVDIALDDKKQIIAPKYFYKILIHRSSNSAIVYITVNNPYIVTGKDLEFCTNVCEHTSYVHRNFRTISKGYTFCCLLTEFKKFVRGLPAEVKATKLLTGTKPKVKG